MRDIVALTRSNLCFKTTLFDVSLERKAASVGRPVWLSSLKVPSAGARLLFCAGKWSSFCSNGRSPAAMTVAQLLRSGLKENHPAARRNKLGPRRGFGNLGPPKLLNPNYRGVCAPDPRCFQSVALPQSKLTSLRYFSYRPEIAKKGQSEPEPAACRRLFNKGDSETAMHWRKVPDKANGKVFYGVVLGTDRV